jgi:5-oxopent-3-ene-1,2,5-tricarboxylate decarboxylase/2-hydroxyhepta-2,4-diene-1,7-dioate isomerase
MTDSQPLPPPTKIIMLHMNYRSRALAHGDFPPYPTYYLKPPSTLAPAVGAVMRPPGCELLIAEGEIALVIGTRAHRVPPDQAWRHVAYIAAANDFTVLDFMAADPSLTRVKGWDGFTPIGNLVDARTIDPGDLRLRVTVNGETRQSDSTRDLLFSFADLVCDLSGIMTLEPGDILLTGTPAGARPVQPGDEVLVDIEGLSAVRTLVRQSHDPLSALTPRPRVTPAQRAHALGVAAARPVVLDSPHWGLLRSGAVRQLADWLAARKIATVDLGLPLTTGGQTVAGHAYPIRLLPRRPGDQPSSTAALAPLAAAGPDEIVVVAANGDQASAALPGDMVKQLAARRVESIVTDGALPDHPGLASTATATPTTDWESGHRLADLNTSVVIAGVTIEPGDVIVADAEMAIVLPADGLAQFASTRPRRAVLRPNG